MTRDNRMVLCELPLNHDFNECMNFTLREVDDYTLIEQFEDLEQEKRSA